MLVLSSDSEGFGNVVVEALLLHTPVASTRCPGGVTEILTGELARGLADLTSPALAQTMQSIYHNRRPSTMPRWKNSASYPFVSSTVSCSAPDAVS
ncbi:glycosyltransferase [Klebsiella pneumoniae]|uniref:Glycosyltransferase n=1 Tax=Klebsiella pneumoniae TaxID=573 RepID=A0A2X3CZE9_KLEPN|nr:glycosyltransferase [Klebsiella pneumoniae]